jgi:hypothetical protein
MLYADGLSASGSGKTEESLRLTSENILAYFINLEK